MGSMDKNALKPDGGAEAQSVERQCGCCGRAGRMAVLARAESAAGPIPTSGPTPLEARSVVRALCPACGVAEAVYEPSDALRRHQRARGAPALPRNAERRRLQEKAFLDKAAARFGTGSDGAALHIRCGDGGPTRRLAHRFQAWRVIGIDPSPELRNDWPPAPGRPGFIRDDFNPHLFAGQTFQAVIADGLFSRVSPATALASLRSVCTDDALVLADVDFLDTGILAPHLWDVPYLFTARSFASLAAQAGFAMGEERQGPVILSAAAPDEGALHDAGAVMEAQTLFAAHVRWWRRAAIRAERSLTVVRERGERIALDGTDAYAAVLAALVPVLDPACYIDEAHAGETFGGAPVVSPAEAKEQNVTVLVCAPGPEAQRRCETLRKAGLKVIDLLSDAPLSLHTGGG